MTGFDLWTPVELFYAYAHEDEALRATLEKHLSLLHRQGVISEWSDRNITAGTDWTQAIDEHLEQASIILLLISADFLASDYCYGVEMKRALERDRAHEARVIPILLRAVDWHDAPFAHLQALPTGARPITSWANQDEAFTDVAAGIRIVVQEFLSRTKEQWLEEGHRYHKAKLYEKALVDYERALHLDMNYARAQRNKGDALYDLRRYTEALDAYALALRLDPNSARTHRNRAGILWRLGQYTASLNAYDRAIQLTPSPQLYNEKGDALYRLGRYEEALQTYEQATKIDAHFAYAHNNIGNALVRLNRYQEAIAAYEQAIQLDPTFAHPYNNMGRALFYLGRYRESLIAYEHAIQLDPKFAHAYDNCAEALEKLGRIHEAELAREKALELRNAK